MQLYQKATTLKSQQQYAAAADAFEEAIRAGHKEGALCHNEKGECYEELGQLDKAVHEFDRALQHDGENPSYLYVRLRCLTQAPLVAVDPGRPSMLHSHKRVPKLLLFPRSQPPWFGAIAEPRQGAHEARAW